MNAPDSFHHTIRAHLLESARVKQAMAGAESIVAGTVVAARVPGQRSPLLDTVVRAAEAIAATFERGGKLLLCGNGGSAADCQHMAAEFMNLLHRDFQRKPLPAIAITTDTSFLTAFGNDFNDFKGVFERQVRALGKPGDALIAISTSGSSPNVLAAVAAAREGGLHTIALSGSKGALRDHAEIAIAVPSTDTHHIQEAHLALEHVICRLVEQILFGEQPPPSETFDPAV